MANRSRTLLFAKIYISVYRLTIEKVAAMMKSKGAEQTLKRRV